MFKKQLAGFSLIEVMVFVVILTTFFTSALAVVSTSIRNAKLNEHKVIATHYTEELYEWLKGEKEADFSSFAAKATTFVGKSCKGNSASCNIYCFNDQLTVTSSGWSKGSCSGYTGMTGQAPEIYKREVQLTSVSPTNITASISVTWEELGRTQSVTNDTSFFLLE